jgi:FAD/FMN-containing dehydrogenase
MILSGWGGYPKINCNVSSVQTHRELTALLSKGEAIARGNGRSYGDSAISFTNTIEMRWFDQYLGFDTASGVLSVSAGVQLRDILQNFVPRGWFLPVTPGTSFVSVGGAIASDVHGKNHHLAGTFGQYIQEIDLMLGSGEIIKISPVEHSELFHATCGGMGLTGLILSAKLKLMPLATNLIKQKTVKASNIRELLELFEKYENETYSVAWIDCLARGDNLGRSLLFLGTHAGRGQQKFEGYRKFSIPVDAPSFLLNNWSIKKFNQIYFRRGRHNEEVFVTLSDYFFPLDKISNWNRLYGSKGFVQYQFVIPKKHGVKNMQKILTKIAESGEGSFLAVIKLFGEENNNLLSFPFKGYTLALDFKASDKTFKLLKELDQMLIEMNGRIYLTKDALMSADTFKLMYHKLGSFERIRKNYGAIGKFSSAQSNRLGLQ